MARARLQMPVLSTHYRVLINEIEKSKVFHALCIHNQFFIQYETTSTKKTSSSNSSKGTNKIKCNISLQ